MIKIVHQVGKEYVVANYPQNEAEEKSQQELVQASKLAQGKYQRVGLWILAEMELEKYHIVVSSINRKVDLCEDDLVRFRAAIMEKLEGEKHAG